MYSISFIALKTLSNKIIMEQTRYSEKKSLRYISNQVCKKNVIIRKSFIIYLFFF